MNAAGAATLEKRSVKSFLSARRSWILASLAAANIAACASMQSGPGGGGAAGAGAIGSSAGYGGAIDVDASSGGSSSGDFAALCGRAVCDLSAAAAVVSCEDSGTTGGGAGS